MRRVFITGASRGIGLEFARQFLAGGDDVFAACRQPERAESLKGLGGEDRLKLIPLHVDDETSIEQSYTAVRALTDSLDILINNAGVTGDEYDKLGTLTQENILRILRTNTVGPMLVCQRYLSLLRRGKGGQPALIVNITSEYGSLAQATHHDTYAYAASKAALNMFTRSLASEVQAENIAAFVIDPGWVQTDMGGPYASLTPERTVTGMKRIIDRASLAESSRFFRWDGHEMAW
jgi:NAD(P)-dependent dehydrogenase (short-subunit alcohol dehydrogenase family)